MVTLQAADRVLKTVYLDAVSDQLNNQVSPFLAAIQKGSEEISGKSINWICRYGVNGGMGSASESGPLPVSGGNNYFSFNADLKNIYGTIEVSDKALRASRNSAGALVNILNGEMEGLLEAAKFNFQRMLWQNGNGVLAEVASLAGHTSKANIPVTAVTNLVEGMVIDFVGTSKSVVSGGYRITKVDREANKIYFSPNLTVELSAVPEGTMITLQQSYNAEIYGLPYAFECANTTYYGVPKVAVESMLPLNVGLGGKPFGTEAIQTVLDRVEMRSSSQINMILSSFDVRRKYLSYLETTRTNIDYMNLDGGFKALSYNGIPVVADKFAPVDTMYFVNTNDFKLVELCDWQWLEGENGSVLTQLEKAPAYVGTLVKYANLICTRPMCQARLTGIVA